MIDRLSAQQVETYRALMEVAGVLRSRLEEHLRADSRVTHVQFEILGRLMSGPAGGSRMTDLADGLVLSRSGLTYQVTALDTAGLITRGGCDADDRAVLVELSPAGRTLFLELLPNHIEIVREALFNPLTSDEAEALGSMLTTVRDHARNRPPRSGSRVSRRDPPPRT